VTETRLEKLRNRIETRRGLLQHDYSSVRSNPDLTESAKRRKLAELHEKAQAEHRKLRDEAEAERKRVKEDAQRRLYSPLIPRSAHGAERQTYLLSLRDAVDRTKRASEDVKNAGEKLEELYQLASRHGDVLLKYAAFARGFLSGGFVNSYLDEQHLRDAYEVVNADEKVELMEKVFDQVEPPAPAEILARGG
jgi:cell division septum initiation protein DivIVA